MPDDPDTNDVMARAAIAWYIRLKDGMATDADRAPFREWVAADSAHGHAYEAATRLSGSA